MISGYRQLTGKYLKSNKKRTSLTIIGIILSVALISSIGLFFKGMQEAQIEDAKNKYGSFHLLFSEANEDLISKISNNPKISRSGLYSMGEEIKVDSKLVMNEVMVSDKALELLPYRIEKGRFPENEKEVAIEKWVLRRINKNINLGEIIKFGEKQYTLTGILEDNIEGQINDKGVILSKSNEINTNKAMLLVEVSSRANLIRALDELKNLSNNENVAENWYLVGLLGADNGGTMSGLYGVIAIVISIVMVATIAVIYNAFQISVVERIKQFGLLRAVGTTPKQIRTIVLREATLLAIIGVPLGLLFGVIAIYGIGIAFKIIGGDTINIMKPSISPSILALSGLVGLISIYLSALVPAVFAGRISPLVAISSRSSITKEKIKRRKSKITGKIFGFEGSLASKNIKRNRKRYRITVFSIVISVVLFITFKSFMDMSLNVSSDLNESKNIHFSIIRDQQSTIENMKIEENIVERLKSSNLVDKVYKVYDPYFFQLALNKEQELKEVSGLSDLYKYVNVEGTKKTLINGSIVTYDKNSLEASKKYMESGKIDIEELNRENGVIVINKNRIWQQHREQTYYGPVANIKVGDELDLQRYNPSKEIIEYGKGKLNKVKVMAIVKYDPFNFRGYEDGIKFITTEEVSKKLIGEDNMNPINLNLTIKDVRNEETALKELEEIIESNSSLKIINNIDRNRKTKSSILMIKILLYGFVIVVSLIGSVNIVNTVTTNIILRKREFATLKSIGLSQQGLKKMIVLEGLLYGVVGTIYGSIIGCGLSYAMYIGFVGGSRDFAWNIPMDAIVVAGVSALFIGYISVLFPLRRIKKENLIEAIREDY